MRSRAPSSGWGLRELPSLLLLGLGVGWMLWLFRYSFDMGDEGVALLGGWRIAMGDVPHRDFVENVPPLSFLPTAAIFRLLGPTVVAERSLVLVYGVLLLVGAEGLLRRLGAGLLARCAVLAYLIPFGVMHWPIPSHHWVVDLLQLFSAWALLAALQSERVTVLAALSGLLAGLGVFALQDQGAYFLALAPAAILLWEEDRARRKRVLVTWCGGAAAAGIAMALYLLPRVSVVALWQQWAGFHLGQYGGLAGNQGHLFKGWELLRAAFEPGALVAAPLRNGSLLLIVALQTTLPFVAPAALVAILVRRREDRKLAAVLLALAAAHLGACLHRWALLNIVWASPPLIIGVAWALDGLGRRSGKLGRRASQATLAALVVLVAIFAVTRIVTPVSTAALEARAGTYYSDRFEDVRATAAVLAAIEDHVPEGAPLFCNGYFSLFNFLAHRPNPTRFNTFIHPGYHSDEQAREVVASLQSRPEAFVLTATPLRDTIVDRFLAAQYRPVWFAPYAALYARR